MLNFQTSNDNQQNIEQKLASNRQSKDLDQMLEQKSNISFYSTFPNKSNQTNNLFNPNIQLPKDHLYFSRQFNFNEINKDEISENELNEEVYKIMSSTFGESLSSMKTEKLKSSIKQILQNQVAIWLNQDYYNEIDESQDQSDIDDNQEYDYESEIDEFEEPINDEFDITNVYDEISRDLDSSLDKLSTNKNKKELKTAISHILYSYLGKVADYNANDSDQPKSINIYLPQARPNNIYEAYLANYPMCTIQTDQQTQDQAESDELDEDLEFLNALIAEREEKKLRETLNKTIPKCKQKICNSKNENKPSTQKLNGLHSDDSSSQKEKDIAFLTNEVNATKNKPQNSIISQTTQFDNSTFSDKPPNQTTLPQSQNSFTFSDKPPNQTTLPQSQNSFTFSDKPPNSFIFNFERSNFKSVPSNDGPTSKFNFNFDLPKASQSNDADVKSDGIAKPSFSFFIRKPFSSLGQQVSAPGKAEAGQKELPPKGNTNEKLLKVSIHEPEHPASSLPLSPKSVMTRITNQESGPKVEQEKEKRKSSSLENETEAKSALKNDMDVLEEEEVTDVQPQEAKMYNEQEDVVDQPEQTQKDGTEESNAAQKEKEEDKSDNKQEEDKSDNKQEEDKSEIEAQKEETKKDLRKDEVPILEEEEEDVENQSAIDQISTDKLQQEPATESRAVAGMEAGRGTEIETADKLETRTPEEGTPDTELPTPSFQLQEPSHEESSSQSSSSPRRIRIKSPRVDSLGSESMPIREPDSGFQSSPRTSSGRVRSEQIPTPLQLGKLSTTAPTDTPKSATIIAPNPEQVNQVSSSRSSQHISVMASKSIQVSSSQSNHRPQPPITAATMKEASNSPRRSVPITPALLNLKKKAKREEPLDDITVEQLQQLLFILNEERKMHAREHHYKEGLMCNSVIHHVSKFYEIAKKKRNGESQNDDFPLKEFDEKTIEIEKEIIARHADNRKKILSSQKVEIERVVKKEESLKRKLNYLLAQERFKEAEEVQKLIDIKKKEEEEEKSNSEGNDRSDELFDSDYSIVNLKEKNQQEILNFEENCKIELQKFREDRSKLRQEMINNRVIIKEDIISTPKLERLHPNSTSESLTYKKEG